MSDRVRLVLLSFLMLFVELALIRWAGSNVVYLSYFANFVLLGSFLGIGVGFLRARARVDTFRFAPIALAFLIGFIMAFPVEINRSGSDLIYFGSFIETGLPIWITLPIIFLAVAAVMAMIAEGVARVFIRFEPLDAYRLDITGSLLGIVGFSALAFLHAPPVVWGLVTAVLFLILVRKGWLVLRVVATVGIVIMLGRESTLPGSYWSPYYKIRTADTETAIHISVNGIPHQGITTTDARLRSEPIYGIPYDRASVAPDRVLVVGAGNGADVAIALRAGATHVDAVEIDPELQRLGERLNPERPYDDPRVEVHIDDGRAYMEGTNRTYDLILFALPDSLTLVSGQSSLRLESYLFTTEALEAARERLAPDGVFAMYNYYRETWLIDRLGASLAQVYGHAPCLDMVSEKIGLAALTIGRDRASATCDQAWSPMSASVPEPVTDNYPFLYLREPSLPGFYLATIALILFASLAMVRVAGGGRPRRMLPYFDLFLMGAAFLLLEAKSIVQFALLFGTTWFVNALVFGGILGLVLLAIEVTRRFRLPPPRVLYAFLLVSVLIGWAVPPNAVLDLPIALRFVAAVGLWLTPIFLANLVFAQRFKDVGASNVAFGANLLGAMVGGVLEYVALVSGYQTLAIIVAVLYALAFAFWRLSPRLNRWSFWPGRSGVPEPTPLPD